ncbi:hypothetical protein halTADL_2267 [Halohasta litchfieldiae]|jgi:uncharacterized membrane protein|uniref:Uncharacterized protein n=1 Tax=Halohasta litchfieldiae TaxID=1073996 RepID=A0A1H6XG65_9EURY|nr:hypothetical protein [Halohasta litchfieldiae]ATW89014.1 hypothetical protein halTADL_2267 [Halohasta litchfieldiae]SEJ28108.1 hypothetical protein SAMN05444271_13915 [Halohasta litchfieldiae]
MDSTDIIGIGLLLLVLSFVFALVSSGLLIPLGVLVLLVGLGLYGFERYHEKRMAELE